MALLPHPRLIAAGVALVLAFGAGWAVQGWRIGAEYAALEMRHATRLAQAHETALTEYARLEKVKNDAGFKLALISKGLRHPRNQ